MFCSWLQNYFLCSQTAYENFCLCVFRPVKRHFAISTVWILCVLDRASSWYLNKGRPNWWHLLYYVNLLLNSQSRYITPTRLKSVQYSLHNNAPSIRKLLKMDVLTSETCWAVNWHNKASVIKFDLPLLKSKLYELRSKYWWDVGNTSYLDTIKALLWNVFQYVFCRLLHVSVNLSAFI